LSDVVVMLHPFSIPKTLALSHHVSIVACTHEVAISEHVCQQVSALMKQSGLDRSFVDFAAHVVVGLDFCDVNWK